MNQDNSTLKIAWVTLLAFFAAFSKELNDKAKGESETLLMFISEILLNGVCGVIIGAFTLSFTKNIYFISGCSAVGGLFGLNAVKLCIRYMICYISAVKNVDISELDTNLDEKEKEKKE